MDIDKKCFQAMGIERTRVQGIELKPHERYFLEEHAASCKKCRIDRKIIRVTASDLGEGTFGTDDELSKQRLINDVFVIAAITGPADNQNEDSSASRHRPYIIAFGSALAASIVIFAIVGIKGLLGSGSEPSSKSEKLGYIDDKSPLVSRAELKEDTQENGTSTSESEVIETGNGRALIKLSEGIIFLVSKKGRVRFRRTDRLKVEITLLQGEILASVDPGHIGPQIVISTELGQVEVKGTIFTVLVYRGSIQVKVLRGEVQITDTEGVKQILNSGKIMSLVTNQQWNLSSTQAQELWADVSSLEFLKNNEDAVVDLSGMFKKAFDVVTPLKSGNLNVKSSKTEKKNPIKEKRPSIEELVRKAREFLMARNWSSAVETYRDLIRLYPGTDEAFASFIALGEIELDELGNAKSALRSFNTYLKSGRTTLTQEAIFGKARALKILGETAEEKRTLELFQSKFPNAMQKALVQKRLSELNAEN